MPLDAEPPDDNDNPGTGWFEDYAIPDDDAQIGEYDISAIPNDFNVTTIFSFIESGAVKIPGFQRNYVWDQKRASKLIESIIIGLPVPQVFLYEETRNRFLVIDGQQRLMSIYYFMKQRFPRKEKRLELRRIFDDHSRIPEEVLSDDAFFTKFNLQLAEKLPGQPNRFKGRNYLTLDEYKTQFDLRTIRNIVVKQNSPEDDDSSIYEIFNRLNSGGVNLRPQEIRASLYHSEFFETLYRVNGLPAWRRILGLPSPDLHAKDIEVLLRGFAMLVDGATYAPSMTKFLNKFSKKSRKFGEEENRFLEKLLESFLESCSELPENAFRGKRTRKFNLALFEAVFYAVCLQPFQGRTLIEGKIDPSLIASLESDTEFVNASQKDTTGKVNVAARLLRAKHYLG